MTFAAILKEIKSGKFRSVYCLHGAEPYFIDTLADAIEEHALQEHERAFNQTILYGKEADHLAVVDAARRFPMMAERQLVILREAQEMRSLKELQSYVEKPSPTTVLVICHKYRKLPGNTRLGKALKTNALVFESKPLYDNQVPQWVESYLDGQGLGITSEASALLTEYLGTDLAKIANELDKLKLNLPEGARITPQVIEEQIGISKEYNVFELQRALGGRDIEKANRIVNYFASNPKKNPLVVVLGSLYSFYSRLYQYLFLQAQQKSEQQILDKMGLRSSFFLRDYRAAARHYNRRHTETVISLLAEYDLKSKGVGYNSSGKPDGELLKEMVWRILHPQEGRR